MKLNIRKNLISLIYIYTALIYVLSTIKRKLKAKWYFIYGLIFLLAMKPRINEEFRMVPKFLLKEMLFLMSLSSVIKTGQAQN